MTEANNNQPATKDDLADLRTNFENDFMEELRSIKSALLSAFEASVMKGQMYTQKAVTHGDILSGHEEKLLNHETRLASLESK